MKNPQEEILTPLNLPKRETSDSLNKETSERYSPPLEGLGEVECPDEDIVAIPGYITANPNTYHLIKEIRDNLKQNPTKEEAILWSFLKNNKTGYHIRRQHIIDIYIADFVCLSKNLVIEIDGKIHLKQIEQDKLRTLRLNEIGFNVIRFSNEEVNENPEMVFKKIKEILDKK